MIVFKCKMCGGDLDVSPEMNVGTCRYCGSVMTLPKLNDEKRANLYERANTCRIDGDYDRAADIYETILSEDITDAEAYWSLVLCKYGIEYVEDPQTRKRIPTCNRLQKASILTDKNYKKALTCAEGEARALYEEEAQAISLIQKSIRKIANNEKPFDIFICCKETDDRGRRTPDSVIAYDIYAALAERGYNVFYSRVTLEDKPGTSYEPYIFAALSSAKVMLAVGTRLEYFNAVWVKNEWSRYLALVNGGEAKTLIPAFKGMKADGLPEELRHLQAQDLSELGFMQDLLRGIEKILPRTETVSGGLPEGMEVAIPVWTKFNIDATSRTILGISGKPGTHAFIPANVKALAPGAFSNTDEWVMLTCDDKAQLHEIPDNAFAGCKNLETVILPGKLASIGKGAFAGCRKLAQFNIPDALKSIGEEAFMDCDAIELIGFPRGSASVGKRAFAGCGALNSVSLQDVNSLGEEAFAGCHRLKEAWFHGSNMRLTSIPRGAFANCTSLVDVMFPDKLKTIEEDAFRGCTSLQKLDFAGSQEGLRTIRKNAFAGCTKLRSIIFSEEFKSLEEGAFASCTALESMDISARTSVASGAFEGCINIKNIKLIGKRIEPLAWIASLAKEKMPRIVFKGEFTIIGDNAFRDCDGLLPRDISDFPYNIVSIGENAFAGLASLQKFTVANSVTVIKESAFAGCTSLRKVIFDGDHKEGPLKTIGDRAFAGCTALTDIVIPPNVESVGPDAFDGCDNLKSIEIRGTTRKLYYQRKIIINHPAVASFPDDETSIDDNALKNLSGVKNVTIPKGVTSIGESAFEGCAELESIVLPPKLKHIGKRAFKDCTALRSIIIPKTISSIGREAFKNCTSLASLTLPMGDRLYIEEEVFAGCTALREITMPVEIFSHSPGMFTGCTALQKVTFLPFKEKYLSSDIPPKTFMDCTTLESITFPGNVTLCEQAFAGCTALKEVIFNQDKYCHCLGGGATWENVFKGTPYLEQTKRNRCNYCGGKLSFVLKRCKICGGKKKRMTEQEKIRHRKRRRRWSLSIITTLTLACAFLFWFYLIPSGQIRYVEKKFVPAHTKTETGSVMSGGVDRKGRPRRKTTSREVHVPDKWYLIVADKKDATFKLEITRAQYKSDWLKDGVWSDYSAFQDEFHGRTDYLSKATGVAGLKYSLKGVVSLIFKDIKRKYGMGNICGFALYCDEDGRSVSVAVNTYEHYNRYITGNPASKLSFKFNPEKWSEKPSNNDLYKINDRLTYTSADTKKKERTEYRNSVYKMCFEILDELKKENLFQGAKTDFVLMFSVIHCDDIPEAVIEFNKKHNSKDVINEYEQWLLN
jgi:hypothetical protein